MAGVAHGGLQDAELATLGLDRDEVVDLSANLHPAGPSPAVLAAARETALDRYPPPDAGPLRDAIAAHHDLDPSMVLVTPGATAGIHLLAHTLLRPGDQGLLFPPTFGEYRAAIEAAGATPIEQRSEPPAFAVTAEPAPAATLCYLCLPNNPTGAVTTRAAIERLCARLDGGTLVLDVAYQPFLDPAIAFDPHALVRAGAPVVVLHSMTKQHAIPGLRLGYLVGAPDVIARLARMQPAWSIDAPAMAAGLVAIEQIAERAALLGDLAPTREAMRAALHALGCRTAPGHANFLLAETGDAASTRRALLVRGFAVRDATSFGLPGWVRVAVPAATVAERFIAALPGALAEVRG